MLIGICGGICAGKSSIADYLVSEHGFKRIRLDRNSPTPPVEKSATNEHVPESAPPRDGAAAVNEDGDANETSFPNVNGLLEFVTKRWRERWVTTDIWDEAIVDALLRRPFFLLVSVDAPVSVRWERFKARCIAASLPPPTLTDFVVRNDAHLFAAPTHLSSLLHRAQLRLLNATPSLSTLHEALRSLDLANPSRLRPSWDAYFMTLASLAAQRSNCMKRRVGCVLVSNNRVLSTGYNGTPRGMRNCNEGGCARCNAAAAGGSSLATCLCLHAEENALLEAGRERIKDGSILYCDTCPCLTCSIKITQVGITEVVYSLAYSMDTEAARIFDEGGVKLRQFVPPRDGLVDLAALAGTEVDLASLEIKP
ncbi:cytidine deaminase-like protein [Phyllosticta capitalensis]|uniref:dCMP deaminase n=1 Tax=Phyllosticta capitalensis TaxID=121624 RepID=A0ABR1YFJ9_9PEZI